ncbi:MAG: response regulator, partial [Natronomonas sp.]
MAADTSPISVLCVDDEPGMADLIETYLERNDERLAVTTASSAADGLSFLDEQDFDCIVSDYDMADMDGLLFLEAVRAEWPDLPFILFTGRGSEEIASEAISAGVTDYMQKGPGTDQYEVLARRVTNAVSRYRLQKQAAAKQEHAETILRASPNAIFVSVDDACVYSNPAAIDFLALSEAGDAVGESVSTLLGVDSERFPSPPTDDPFERERLSLPARNRSVEVTTREITWDDTAATIYILRDITEQLEYETRLKHQQSILDSTFEASPSGVIITDEDRNIITYNQQFVDLWGIPESILETGDGRLAVEAVLDRLEDPDSFVKNLDRQHNDPSSETQQNRIELTDGTVLDQYAAPVVSDDGTRYGYVRFYRDITELTQLQQAQKDVFDRMTDAVFAVSPEWEFTFLNEQAARLLQRDAEDLLGANLWEEFPEAASGVVFERYHEAMETGESVTFEVYYEPLETDFEIRAYPSKTGLTVYFRDITETRRTKA